MARDKKINNIRGKRDIRTFGENTQQLPLLALKMSAVAIILFLSISGIKAQSKELIAEVKTEAEKFAALSKSGEGKFLVKMMHQAIVDDLGGRKKAIKLIEENHTLLEASGTTIESIIILEPINYFVHDQKAYFLIPQELLLNNSDGGIKVKSYLIAESGKKGWKFINSGNLPEEKISQLLGGGVSDQLNIPEKSYTSFERDGN